MNALFGFQDVLDIVKNGYAPLVEPATEVQRQAFKENRKKDCKALFFLHQCVDGSHFEKIAFAETSKAAWDALAKACSGDDKLKRVKL
uniref:Uncharacterized protein n=1 Tax=Cajanus cajan TaxID=3821 RepID=A0A151RY46_CAJCA|nr:hypothetical protein KK1_031001 [Cajanus cajan]